MRREIGHSRVPAPPDKIMGMILVNSEQIPGEYFVAHIVQFINHAIGNDDIAAWLKAIKLMGDFRVEEMGLIKRRFINDDLNTLCLYPFHHSLHGR